jgi:hypothetical protein
MIKLIQGVLDIDACQTNLDEFKSLLDARPELRETGAGSLQAFFNARMNLLLLMGESFGPGMWPAH